MRIFSTLLTIFLLPCLCSCGSSAHYLPTGTVGVTESAVTVVASVPDATGKLVPHTSVDLPAGTMFKYGNAAKGTFKALARQAENQCQACAKQAADAENRTYKQSVAEMKAVHDREQARIKAQYDACPAGEAVIMSGPSVGDTIVTTPVIPDAGEVIPETGLFKAIQPTKQCKDGICK